jgi:hypothetical protein
MLFVIKQETEALVDWPKDGRPKMARRPWALSVSRMQPGGADARIVGALSQK